MLSWNNSVSYLENFQEMQMIKKLLPYMKDYKWQAIFSPVLMIIDVFGDILIPFLMSLIVDVGIANQDTSYIFRVGTLMVGVSVAATLIGIYSTHLGASAGYGFASNIRSAAFARIQNFSFSNLDHLPPSTLITRITNDCNTLGQVTMMTLRMAIRAPFLMLFALIMSYRVNSSLARVFLVVIPIMVFGTYYVVKKARPLFERMQQRVDGVNKVIQENLTGIRVVKSFNRQSYSEEKFKVKNDELQASSLEAISLMITLMPLLNLLIYSCILAVLWFGGRQIMAGTMQKGALISFITYITQIMMALMMMSFYFIQATRGLASTRRIVEILDTEPDMSSSTESICVLQDGSIEFKDVYFAYPESSQGSLLDIDLFISSGETIGIIGSTGSAKITLVQLIPRLYDPQKGSVMVGERNVKEYDLTCLRDQVSFVLQTSVLFSGTLRENMLWGDPEASDEKILWALEKAQAFDFVSTLQDGLDHPVEQAGTNFSGGQRQRLAIARGLMKDPKIIILDDSTSAVDVSTDAKIRQTFSEELAGITTIIIAQRISSVVSADRIIVMEKGRIDAIGTHEELLKSSTIYQEIYHSQQKGMVA